MVGDVEIVAAGAGHTAVEYCVVAKAATAAADLATCAVHSHALVSVHEHQKEACQKKAYPGGDPVEAFPYLVDDDASDQAVGVCVAEPSATGPSYSEDAIAVGRRAAESLSARAVAAFQVPYHTGLRLQLGSKEECVETGRLVKPEARLPLLLYLDVAPVVRARADGPRGFPDIPRDFCAPS
jgi:hypothetical protein